MWPAIEEMFTTAPPPRSHIMARQASVQLTTPNSASFATSQRTETAAAPDSRSAAAVAAALSSMSASTTAAPSAANARATARPNPTAPPVTKATLLSKRITVRAVR